MAAVAFPRVIVSVTSLPRALGFYRDCVGLEVESGDATTAVLTAAGRGPRLLLHERPVAPSDAAVCLAVAVERLDDVVARWSRDGGEVVDPAAEQPWGERMAMVRDADGHLVSLVEAE